jgi:SsrA-binding protein
MPTLAKNKEAYYSFSIEDTLEAGLVLLGHEVKSIKSGQVSLKGAYVTVRNEEAYLRNAHIGKYKHASRLEGYDETRERKLLLHKKEIHKLQNSTNQKGVTLVPLELYTKKRNIKLKIGIGKGKKQYDKRTTIKKKEIKRKLDRAIRQKI